MQNYEQKKTRENVICSSLYVFDMRQSRCAIGHGQWSNGPGNFALRVMGNLAINLAVVGMIILCSRTKRGIFPQNFSLLKPHLELAF